MLLMHDRVDEWMMSYLNEYDGKSFVNIAKGELDLGKLADKEEKKKAEKATKDFEKMLKQMKDSLGDKVKEVRVSTRLTDSPSCLVVEQQDMAVSMQKILKQAGHEVPNIEPILEVNVEHPLLKRLNEEQSDEKFSDLSHLLFDQAMLSEGGQLEDPVAFVTRMNQLLLETM